jgi:type II secretory pathway predicted ATPase ExeA
MYQSHFQLHRTLFHGGDRSRHFFLSQSIREIQPRLLRMLRGSLGPCLLTARQGAGRTALLRRLRAELENEGRTIVVSGAALNSTTSLLQLLLHCAYRQATSAAIAPEKVELTHWGVVQQLQKSADFWGPIFLLLDDAHLVAAGLLNELRALSEEEWQGRSLVRILISAPLSFEMELGRTEYANFAQRVCCHEVLQPLTVVESLELLRLEIEAAGGRPESVFTESAAAIMATASEGLPRQLSLLAGETLAVAADEGLRPADEHCVRIALKRLRHLPLSWNLPASPFGEETTELATVATAAFEESDSTGTKSGSIGHGVLEIGGPAGAEIAQMNLVSLPEFDTTSLISPDYEEITHADQSPTNEADWPRPLAEVQERMSPAEGDVEVRSFWDPEMADFSSVIPVPERSSGPLNYGLISGDTDWYLSKPSVSSAVASRDSEISEFGVVDGDVLLKRTAPDIPILLAGNPPKPELASTPESTQNDLTLEPRETSETASDLFRAFTGRRLATSGVFVAERQIQAVPEGPISLPLWRDGLLFRQPAIPAERADDLFGTPTVSSRERLEPTAGSAEKQESSDSGATADSRFANLFTRLRRLQADADQLNAEPG